METYFNDDQYAMSYPEGVEAHWWYRARGALVAGLIRSAGAEQGVILEVGCGRGVEVGRLRRAGFEARGVEPAQVQPVQVARDFVSVGLTAEALPAQERARVETILLLDVVEHVPEPHALLRTLKAAFPALANIIVTVPARQELWSNYDEYFGHFVRYDLDMLEGLAQALDWRLAKAGYFFRISYPPGRLLALLGRERNLKITAPAGPLGHAVHALLDWVCRAEYRLLPRRVWGTSAYALLTVDGGSG